MLILRVLSRADATRFVMTDSAPLDEQPFPTTPTSPRVSTHVVQHDAFWRTIDSPLPQTEEENQYHLLYEHPKPSTTSLHHLEKPSSLITVTARLTSQTSAIAPIAFSSLGVKPFKRMSSRCWEKVSFALHRCPGAFHSYC